MDEFAVYSVITSSVVFANIFGSLGLDRVLYRFLPLAQVVGRRRYAKLLILGAIGIRLPVAIFATVVCIVWTGVHSDVTRLDTILVLSACLAGSLTISDMLSVSANALHRFEGQARIMLTALLLRVGLLFVLHLTLPSLRAVHVVIIAMTCDMLQATTLFLTCIRPAVNSIRAPGKTTSDVELPDWRGLIPQASVNYVSYFLGLPWQGSTARLVVARVESIPIVALFSLLQMIMDRVKQYLPLQLLQAAVEPILVREYAEDGDRSKVTAILDLIRRTNFIILLGVAAICCSCGTELVEVATHGKYHNAGPMAAAVIVSSAFSGLTMVLFIGANVFNQMRNLMFGYGAITFALAPLMLLSASRFGAYGLLAVTMLPPPLLWAVLRARGIASAIGAWRIRCDVLSIIAAAASAFSGGMLLKYAHCHFEVPLALLSTVAVYVGVLVLTRVFTRADLHLLRVILRRGEHAPHNR